MNSDFYGKKIGAFTDKNGNLLEIRYPKWTDLRNLMEYINTISAEDTYVSVAGQQFSLEDEAKILSSWLTRLELGNYAVLLATHNEEIVGVCNIGRGGGRSEHVATFGLSIRKEYRGLGLGYELASYSIDQAKTQIEGLKMMRLSVYEENYPAQKLYQKLGFQETGRIPEGVKYKDGF